MMELDHDSSARLNLIRFPLVVGVVFIHAAESTAKFGGIQSALNPESFGSNFTREFISRGLAGISVPLFFFMSGFLFFYGFEWSKVTYLRKVRSRLTTLLVPFLFWNLLYLLLIAVAQRIPTTATYFSGANGSVATFGFFDYVNRVIGIDRNPIAFQFWYIRDLMELVVLVPIFYMMHKKAPIIFLALFGFIWFLNIWPSHVLSIIPSPGPILFFYAGSVIAVKKRTPFLLDKYGKMIVCLWLILLITDTLSKGQWFNSYLHGAVIVSGIVTALYSTRILLICDKVRALFLWLASASFFVFAFHEPLMTLIQRVTLKLWIPNTDVPKMFFYFSIPLVVILISICAYKFLRDKFPRITNVITGSRADLTPMHRSSFNAGLAGSRDFPQ